MKIKFDIDPEKKVVRIFFKDSEFHDWIKRAMKDHPKLSTEELAKKGSECMASVTAKTFEKIGKIVELDILQFKAEPVLYKHEAEVPFHLRTANL